MNLKDWMKLEEDDKTVILAHPKGHTMRIYIHALPKIQREQLKRLKMAKGGEVNPGISEQGKDVRHAKKSKDRSERDMSMDFAKEEAKSRAKFEREHVNPKLKGLADGGEVTDDSKDQSDANQSGNPININVGSQAPTTATPAATVIPTQTAMNVPVIPSAKQVTGSSLPQEAQNTLQSVEQGKSGIQGQALIDAAKAQAAVPAIQKSLEQEQNIADQNANAFKEITQHTNDFNDYINKNPIDPKHYQESMGSGQKVGTAIGLFLGGMGTPFGGHNFAFDALQKQIDRDIDAQKQRTENQKTVLGAYEHLYGMNNISTALAKASMNDIYAKKIQLGAAQLGTPQAQVNSNMALQKLGQESEQLRMGAAAMLGNARAQGKQVGPKINQPQAVNHPLQGTLLNSNAESAYLKAKYNPLLKEQMPQLTAQYNQATQADKALNNVNDIFLNLSKMSEEGGIKGRVNRTMSPHTIGALGAGLGTLAGAVGGLGLGAIPGGIGGGAAGEAIGHGIHQMTNTDVNRRYEAEQTNLKGFLSSALKNTNVGGEAIDEIVSKNSPEYGDSEKTKAIKLKAIRDFIKLHTDTSLLHAAKMTQD